ncbi:NACHT domain-containing protein [Amycolatopsis sp. CB00013]|uniref:NACHT domain-containing protein n=1 Tax=Amycolatopsis sp. CB00013 TaxID=1703945 RepID=UPI0009398D4A|nr:NACHT domain-containing protein [Amycolatopsis sp. CB00013]OKJ97884.1 hypothetical protein AMK34_13120 [Amycolatopsis sp. CB00013]
MSRRKAIGLGLVGTGLGVVLVVLAVFLWGGPDLDATQKVVSILGVVISAGSLAVGVATLLRQRAAAGPDLARFAQDVRRRWDREAAFRQVRSPAPIRLRWSSTSRPVTASPAAVVGAAVPGHPVRLRLSGDVSQAAEKYRALPRRQLVILGKPGAGKSTLVMLMLLQLLDTRTEDDPVPYLVPLVEWEGNPLYDWLADRLALEHPGLGGVHSCRRLLTTGRILPLLDGFDELPVQRQARALASIDEATDGDKPVVLTCRITEYEEVIARTRSPLATAAVIELEAVSAGDARSFLDTTEQAARSWEPVLMRLAAEPDGELADALSTPLMMSLARTTYSAPGQLLALTDRTTIQQRLLDGLIPALYRKNTRYTIRDVQTWMTFLARHLDRTRSQTIRWWQLHQALPALARWIMALLFPIAPLGAMIGYAAATLANWPPLAGTGIGFIIGFALTHWVPPRRPRPISYPDLFVAGLGAVPLPGFVAIAFATDSIIIDPAKLPKWGPGTNFLVAVFVVTGISGVCIALIGRFVSVDFDRSPLEQVLADRTYALTQFFWLVPTMWIGSTLLSRQPSILGGLLLVYLCLTLQVSHASSTFRLHRWFLAASGRLPRDLLAFLDDAHQRGLLRRNGPDYEFRHQLLQARLAARARSANES